MPAELPLKRCSYPGCLELTTAARCRRHAWGAPRGSAAARGYDRTWQQCRAMFLRRHPLCNRCSARGLIVEATEVHHIQTIVERPELRLDWANLEALCKPCHSAETMRSL